MRGNKTGGGVIIKSIQFNITLFASLLYGTVSRYPIPSQHSTATQPIYSNHHTANGSIIDRLFPLFFFFLPSIRCSWKKIYVICCWCSSLIFLHNFFPHDVYRFLFPYTAFYADVDRPPCRWLSISFAASPDRGRFLFLIILIVLIVLSIRSISTACLGFNWVLFL